MSIEHSGRLDKEVGSSYVRGRNYKAERRRGMSVFYVMLTDCYRFDKIRGGRHGGLGQYLSYHRHISYNGRAPLRDPSFREAAAGTRAWGQSSGSMLPHHLETSPLPTAHSFSPTRVSPLLCGGLVCTSSLPWPPMVLRGSIMAPQVLPADRTQSS